MDTKLPQVFLVYNRRKTASPSRKASVEIRVAYNYKQKYISTGVMLYPNQWKKGKIVNCKNLLQISQALDSIVSEVRTVLLKMMKEGNINVDLIPDRLRKKNEKQVGFIDFCVKRAEIRKYGKTKDSQERYDRFLRLFTKWGKIREFDDITEANIIAYDKYLTSRRLKPYSKWNNYHRFLNSFIIDAIDEGLLKKNPYKWLNIEKGYNTGISKHLTPEEFKRLKEAKMPTLSIERVRDLFVFQTYTCLSYTDLRDFNTGKIQVIKDTRVYVGNRQKTGKAYTIPILPSAWNILVKYDFKLPVISNVKYNEYLKIVAQSAGIDKPISTHWARHTGATLLLNEGVNMKIVSKICGHSSTRITEQVYAELLDETVVDAISDIKI